MERGMNTAHDTVMGHDSPDAAVTWAPIGVKAPFARRPLSDITALALIGSQCLFTRALGTLILPERLGLSSTSQPVSTASSAS
jgi:hypothetical protein